MFQELVSRALNGIISVDKGNILLTVVFLIPPPHPTPCYHPELLPRTESVQIEYSSPHHSGMSSHV